ncbi:hypothetical protein WI67_00105 [Burkholderia cepacia]|nr:hypothetical protein WI67_00105 [Burkholderia cepacia]
MDERKAQTEYFPDVLLDRKDASKTVIESGARLYSRKLGKSGLMELIDNINRLLGDDLKQALVSGARLKVRLAAHLFLLFLLGSSPRLSVTRV